MRLELPNRKVALPIALLFAILIPIVLLFRPKEGILFLGGLSVLGIAYSSIVLRLEQWMFYLTAFVIPFSAEVEIVSGSNIYFPSEVLIGILTITFLLKLLTIDIQKYHFSWMDLLVVGLVLSLVISSIGSTIIEISMKYTLVYSTYILVFYFYCKHLLSEGLSVKRLIVISSIAVGIVSLYSIGRSAGYGFYEAASRIISKPFYKDHTIMGAALGFAIPFAIGWLNSIISSRKSTILNVIGIVAITGGLIINLWLGHSRAAWLSVLISFALVGILYLRVRAKYLWGIGLVFVLFSIGSIDKITDQLLVNRADSGKSHSGIVEQTQSVTNINSDVSNLERINRWKSAWRMHQDKPWLGFGPGTYQYTYIPYQDERDMTRISTENPYWVKEINGGSAHSEPLLLLAETGWSGFIIWILICVYAIRTFVSLSNSGVRYKLKLEDWMIVALIGFMFHALVNNYLNSDKIAFLFWGCLAVLSFHQENQLRGGRYGKS